MPLMIPDDIEQFTTPGEEVFYRFLQRAAKPDNLFIVWYSPDIGEREPDFILFTPDVGLVVFEVKDWTIDQIREASPKTFRVAFGAREQVKTNPFEQARGYVHGLLQSIADDGRLVCRDKINYGKAKVPISHGVVFSNINSFEYSSRFANDNIIPISRIIFWDDLDPHSELNDPSGKRFLEALRDRFEPIFPCSLTTPELSHLRYLIYPTIRINPVERGPGDELKDHEENIRLLDHHQEAVARRFDGGHRIICGPSGCGKTLVLVHQAVVLQRYNPKVRRILFLCYNVSLVNYIRRLLGNQGATFGPSGVEVLPFFELCERLIGEKVHHEKQDMDYYTLIVDEALTREVDSDGRFDAVLVDEGQDFSDQMLQVVMKCLNRSVDFLTIAMDEGQDLYRPGRSWAKAGINARGRVRQLVAIYRNTREIADFANRFRYGGNGAEMTSTAQQSLFPDPRISKGPCPLLKKYDTMRHLLDHTAAEIKSITEKGIHPLSEIAIIYTTKQIDPSLNAPFPVLAAEALDRQGIIHKWISEDHRSKRSCDITSNSVTITTVHSAKGLDFACVFLVGLDALEPGERWDREQIDSLAYVGITRARYRLEIPYIRKNDLMERILAAAESCGKSSR
jgi:hypothetical protein